MAIVGMDYNITIMARMERGRFIEVMPIKIQAVAAEVLDYTGITDPEVLADNIDLPVTPLLVDSLKSAHRKKQWQGGNLNHGGGQQHRGSPGIIDHSTVNKVMLDVTDISYGGQSRINLARGS
ncbi:hypothetical protein B9Z19DRAFT_1126136 [Tuber borchii]|uniref:Uncharacterized protein n=1 Tax=Tuber borchii TaxID=42251 RepID=A0A2T6ZTF1_TUBBO|nr:hypothetical protein B9Z19DRAFT_1126136 [Tuber borchii]